MKKNSFKLILVSIFALGLIGCGGGGSGNSEDAGTSISSGVSKGIFSYFPKAALDSQIKKMTLQQVGYDDNVTTINKKHDKKYRILSTEISSSSGTIYYNKSTYDESKVFTDSKLYMSGKFYAFTRISTEVKNKRAEETVMEMSSENSEESLFLVAEAEDILWDGLFAKEQVKITYNRDMTIQQKVMIKRTIKEDRVTEEEHFKEEEHFTGSVNSKNYVSTDLFTYEYNEENSTLDPLYYGRTPETLLLGLDRHFIPSIVKHDGEIVEQNTFTYYENGLIKSIKNKKQTKESEFTKITTYEYISKEEIDEEEGR